MTSPNEERCSGKPRPGDVGSVGMGSGTRGLRIDEPDGVWSVLFVPADPAEAALHAAYGLVAAAPDSDGKARATERLNAEDDAARALACEILRDALASIEGR